MAINSYDIVSTLQALGMMKYWKGKHIILKKQVSFEWQFVIKLFILYIQIVLLLNWLHVCMLCIERT